MFARATLDNGPSRSVEISAAWKTVGSAPNSGNPLLHHVAAPKPQPLGQPRSSALTFERRAPPLSTVSRHLRPSRAPRRLRRSGTLLPLACSFLADLAPSRNHAHVRLLSVKRCRRSPLVPEPSAPAVPAPLEPPGTERERPTVDRDCSSPISLPGDRRDRSAPISPETRPASSASSRRHSRRWAFGGQPLLSSSDLAPLRRTDGPPVSSATSSSIFSPSLSLSLPLSFSIDFHGISENMLGFGWDLDIGWV
ncbi:pollen-specific leucine-rich repeat extensin-like protein 4 [Iris pallida]|uniref:Pollen-specific leucine-rich repeat extensin-like protein 4 n=1 Tax=Iris pallida TaxID=29817 RepID=A0AAX6FMY0_IRIPA|nr:pollen-specific leucine-rich repeat extensin-like protein 4 [Iris pallida]